MTHASTRTVRCITLTAPGKPPASARIECAATSAAQARGYSGRTIAQAGIGLLFPFDSPRVARFWMNGMLFPIDVAFFDAGGALTALYRNCVPGDLRQIGPPGLTRWVIETPSGSALAGVLGAGTRLVVGD